MSRTGVGCRLMIDGLQVDDGCLGWAVPGTELRRNLATNPAPVTAVADWAAAGTSVLENGWVKSTIAATTTAYIFTSKAAQAFAIGDVVSLSVDYVVDAIGSGVTPAPAAISYTPHLRAANTYLTAARQWRPIVLGQVERVSVTWTVDRAIVAGDLDFALLSAATGGGNNSAGAGFVFRARRVLIERRPSAGVYFDGDTADTATTDYAWTGAVGASQSVAKVPAYMYPRAGQGVTADPGLQVTWGRATSVDQPSPSSCTFTMHDDPGGLTYVSTVHIGSTVEVFADAVVTGDPVVPAFTDGGFESGVNGTVSGATLDRSTTRFTGAGSTAAARVGAVVPSSKPRYAFLAPGTLQPENTNPSAWDDIPNTGGGETWQIDVDVFAPVGVTVKLRPYLYAGPYASAGATSSVLLGTITGAGAWVHVSKRFAPGVADRWVGLQVEASGAGVQWDQVTPSTTQWDQVDPKVTWDDFAAAWIDNLTVLGPPTGVTTSILVFSGRVTDLEAAYDDGYDAPFVDVTASDFLAELANRYVGTAPWLAESLSTRVTRILGEAHAPGEAAIVADIAPTVADVIMSWQDVDRQAASGLLTDCAQSVDAVLWPATHVVSGPYLRIEDPAARVSMFRLALQGGQIVIVPVDFSAAPPGVKPLDLSACDLLRDPVGFTVDVTDVATRSTIEWLEQTLDDKGNPAPTSRSFVLTDANREAVYGSRTISVSTLLTTAAQAQVTAERIMSRQGGEWRASGLTVDDADFAVPDDVAARAQLRLLSGVERGGLPVQVTDMPAWNPIANPLPAYVEGGQYTFDGGGWSLALIVSRAAGFGDSAQWDQLGAAWTWDQWAPGLTWNDLRGVAGPVA